MYARTNARMHTHTHTHAHSQTHTHTRTHAQTHTYKDARLRVCVCVCVCAPMVVMNDFIKLLRETVIGSEGERRTEGEQELD